MPQSLGRGWGCDALSRDFWGWLGGGCPGSGWTFGPTFVSVSARGIRLHVGLVPTLVAGPPAHYFKPLSFYFLP